MDAIDRALCQWDSEIPQLETDSMALLGRFLRVYKHLESGLTALHKSFGLTPGEFDVLASLRRSGAPFQLTPSALLNALMVTSGAMTNRIDRLEHKTLIARRHSESDRRSVEVALTEQGLELINTLIYRHVELQKQLTNTLSAQELHMLNQLMKKWLSQFEHEVSA